MKEKRQEFLLTMYKELFNNIDRHISFSWSSIGIIGTLGIAIMMTERFNVPAFISVLLIFVITVWMIARLIDANHWYERNIHIISNIEKEFLNDDDDEKVHYYFKGVRNNSNQVESIKIQLYALIGIWIIAIVYYVFKTVEDGSLWKWLGLILFIIMSYIACLSLRCYQEHNNRSIEKLRMRSPGKGYEAQEPTNEASSKCKKLSNIISGIERNFVNHFKADK